MATTMEHVSQPAAQEPVVRRRRSTTAFLVGLGILLILLALWINVKYQGAGLVALGAGVLGMAAWVLAFWQGRAAAPAELARKGKPTAFALFALAALLALIAVWIVMQPAESSFGAVSWTVLLAVLALVGGLWQLTPPAEDAVGWQQRASESLSRHHAALARGFLGLAAFFIALAVVLVLFLGEPMGIARMPTLGWLLFMAGLAGTILATLIGAIVELGTLPERATPSHVRIAVLAVGGLCGLFITLAALGLTWAWWDDAFARGIEGWQEPGAWRFWACAYTLLLGLAVLFGSLLFARPEERTNPVLRRLLYGYNTALTGLLLLATLALLNVVVFASFPADYNWTKTRGLYTLSNSSKHILENLKQPIKVYVLLSQGDPAYSDAHTLLDNCRAVTSKFQVEYVSPDLDREGVTRLEQRFPECQGRGLLVVAGDEADQNVPRAFIARDRLSEIAHGAGGRDEATATRVFKGEAVLMTEVRFLEAGRVKSKVYFTQGNGELDINDTSKDQGAGILRQRLLKDNYDVATWRFRPAVGDKSKPAPAAAPGLVEASELPADAKIVVVAGPREFSPEARGALANYMKSKKGKLVVLAGPEYSPRTAAPVPTGLEGFLKEFNIELATDYLLRLPSQQIQNPFRVPVMMAQNSRNPIAVAFGNDAMLFLLCRTVRAGQGSPTYRAEVLMTTVPGDAVWAETNFQTLRNPIGYLQAILRNGQFRDKIAAQPLPVAITVTDTEKESKPRLVVFGSAQLATNQMIGRPSSIDYDLLDNTLKWLSERPNEIGGIQPLESDIIAYNPAQINWSRMILLPGALMALGIIGLGTGVWVVRRR